MAFVDQESPVSGRVLVGVALAALSAIFWKPLKAYFYQQTVTVESIEREILNVPIIGKSMQAMKVHFPEEFETFINETHSRVKQGQNNKEIMTFAQNFFAQWRLKNIPNISQAPTDELVKTSEITLKLISELKDTNPEICASFSQRGSPPESLSKSQLALFSSLMEQSVVIAKAGKLRPAGRDIPKLQTEFTSAFRTAILRQPLSPGQIKILESGQYIGSPTDICAIEFYSQSALKSLPNEQRAMGVIMGAGS